MKKLLPFFVTFVLVMLIIPLLSLIGSKDSLPKPIKKAHSKDVTIYKILNHKTEEVFDLTPEEYIIGVVAAEMPIGFHTEAIKAQAVAAHTYALRQIDAELNSPTPELKGAYLTTDFTKNQSYMSIDELKESWGKNYDTNYKKLSDAVKSVINEVVTYDKKPIIAAFHSISGGVTENAKTVWGKEVNYLIPVTSEGDELSPNFEVKTALTVSEVEHAFKLKYSDIKFSEDKDSWFFITKKSESNTITECKVGSIVCTGKEIREILKLKSANFKIEYSNGKFTFITNGYGHGVGMSQYGADYLARQGKTYDEILKHYYSGVEIEKIYDENSDNSEETTSKDDTTSNKITSSSEKSDNKQI